MQAPAPAPSRRRFLAGAAAGLAAAAAMPAAGAAAAASGGSFVFVPGYAPEYAMLHGRPLAEDPAFRRFLPKGYAGALTLLTRIDTATGAAARMLLPLAGHHLCDIGDGRLLFSPMHGRSAAVIDMKAMEIVDWIAVHDDGYMFGGHALLFGDGVVTVERPRQPVDAAGAPRSGRLALRDRRSLAVTEVYDAHGIAPHDIAHLGGPVVAVANYGSLNGEKPATAAPIAVAPSITIVDMASGKLIETLAAEGPWELRHLAAMPQGRILGVRTHAVAATDDLRRQFADDVIDMPDRSAPPEVFYRPAPPTQWRTGQRLAPGLGEDAARAMRYGLSACADAGHGEFLVTFPSTHRLGVFDADTGAVRRMIDTRAFGIRHPRGVALLDDGRTYALTGSWTGLALMERGRHEPRPGGLIHTMVFDHSHITAARAA